MMEYKTKNYFLKSYFEENKIGLDKNIISELKNLLILSLPQLNQKCVL